MKTRLLPPITVTPDSLMSISRAELSRRYDRYFERLEYFVENNAPAFICEREAEILRRINVALRVKERR
ncbi:MAG: hypothetical protein KAV00_06965 [Phycisphaerae bacterium]|nr:hypothetical protein [Phycisphaerae bacterium]